MREVALVVLAVCVAIAVVAVIVIVIVCYYRKRLQFKNHGDTKLQQEIRLQELDCVPPTSTLIPAEPESPNQTDRTFRTFSYPLPRGRKSSTGSTNSTSPLIKYRHGSYRSRLSSGVSSRLDSNITEEGTVFMKKHSYCMPNIIPNVFM